MINEGPPAAAGSNPFRPRKPGISLIAGAVALSLATAAFADSARDTAVTSSTSSATTAESGGSPTTVIVTARLRQVGSPGTELEFAL